MAANTGVKIARFSCPSSQPDVEDAAILGVLDRQNGQKRVNYLSGHQEVTQELLDLVHPLEPTEVYRFSGKCKSSECQHFQANECQLAKRILGGMDAVSSNLPACALRKKCRWYLQEGSDICFRCPQISTRFDQSNEKLRKISGLGVK